MGKKQFLNVSRRKNILLTQIKVTDKFQMIDADYLSRSPFIQIGQGILNNNLMHTYSSVK